MRRLRGAAARRGDDTCEVVSRPMERADPFPLNAPCGIQRFDYIAILCDNINYQNSAAGRRAHIVHKPLNDNGLLMSSGGHSNAEMDFFPEIREKRTR